MKGETIIADISARKVVIYKNQYVPIQRKEGKKITGTGVTKKVKVATFKRNEIDIPDEIQESLTEQQIKFLKNELKYAHEGDIAPTINKEFHDGILRLSANISLIHLLDIDSDDIRILSDILAKMKKQQKKSNE